jgi:hypothetical protein
MHGQRVSRLFPGEEHGRSLHEVQEPAGQIVVAGKRVEIGADERDALFENGNLRGSQLVAVLAQPPRDVGPYELGPLFGREAAEEIEAFRPALRAERIVVDGRHDRSLRRQTEDLLNGFGMHARVFVTVAPGRLIITIDDPE